MTPKIKYSDKFLDKISWFMKVGGITLFPYIILRERYETSIYKDKIINHESIHIKQQGELLVLFFYLLYVLFFVLNIFRYFFDFKKAYKNLPFEKEAYANENDMTYLENRKMFSWIKYF